jgi:hypothetical protein
VKPDAQIRGQRISTSTLAGHMSVMFVVATITLAGQGSSTPLPDLGAALASDARFIARNALGVTRRGSA